MRVLSWWIYLLLFLYVVIEVGMVSRLGFMIFCWLVVWVNWFCNKGLVIMVVVVCKEVRLKVLEVDMRVIMLFKMIGFKEKVGV